MPVPSRLTLSAQAQPPDGERCQRSGHRQAGFTVKLSQLQAPLRVGFSFHKTTFATVKTGAVGFPPPKQERQRRSKTKGRPKERAPRAQAPDGALTGRGAGILTREQDGAKTVSRVEVRM